MYHSAKPNVDRVEHDSEKVFPAESLQTGSSPSAKKMDKGNIFSDFFSFLNVGFGISNMDSIESEDRQIVRSSDRQIVRSSDRQIVRSSDRQIVSS